MNVDHLPPGGLLFELMVSMGHDPTAPIPNTKKRTTKAMLAGAPDDPAKRSALFARELSEATPLLGELVAEVRVLRALMNGPQLPDDAVWSEYRSRRRGVVERWNQAHYNGGWLELAPLCEHCGRPVLRRGGGILSSGDYEVSTYCSERCRASVRRHLRRTRPR